MQVQFSYSRYRLRFKHPFGTAHGLRNGTDSVFVRVSAGGTNGYGEATLPPYLSETQDSVIQRIKQFVDQGPLELDTAWAQLQKSDPFFADDPAARAALQMALGDLSIKTYKIEYQQHIEYQLNKPITLMTVGSGELRDLEAKLSETLSASAIKVKLGAPNDELAIKRIKNLDDRMLFLDSNQGLRTVEEALQRIRWAGEDRVLGMEQPFPKDRLDLHAALKARTTTAIYGDESIQDLADLDRCTGAFSGVNVKLMKCGGLDRAEELVAAARASGLNVMLGSMSESSLGCTAMARLADRADVVDLDGPWLLANDPFNGLDIRQGRLVLPDGPGLGAIPKTELAWTPFVA